MRDGDFASRVHEHLSAEKDRRFEEYRASFNLDGSDEEDEVEEQQLADFARAMCEIPTCVDRAEIVRAGRARENWRNSHAFGSEGGVQLLASIVRAAAGGLRVESAARGAPEPAATASTSSRPLDAAQRRGAFHFFCLLLAFVYSHIISISFVSPIGASPSTPSRGRKRGRSPREGAAAAEEVGGGEGPAKRPTPPTVQLLSYATQEVLFPVLSAVARLARHARARPSADRSASVSEELVRAAVASLPPAHHALANLLPLRGGGGAEADGDDTLDRAMAHGGGQ
jgi:hypothetical protein